MVRAARYGYLGMATLFLVGIVAQVFFIGLSLLGRRPSWGEHSALGHMLLLPVLFMVILAYLGRMKRPVKSLTWLTFLNYLLLVTVVFLRMAVPVVAAMHPVLAITMYGLTAALVLQALQAVRSPEQARARQIAEPGSV